MPRMHQIHIDIPKSVWARILAATTAWPSRSMRGICRYALRELYAELHDPEGSAPTTTPICVGEFRVAVYSSDPDETREWVSLAKTYGSKGAALRLALADLLASLERPLDVDGEESLGRPLDVIETDGTAAFHGLLKRGLTQAEIIKATGIDSGAASRVKQGEARLGPKYTSMLRTAYPDAFGL